ncbi:MAG: CPBP family intramembrane metalloprotease [Rubellimicrobium sp.]|nr:CPBP family intramembrane metalloprotease [Rubellimicrobium sp.]
MDRRLALAALGAIPVLGLAMYLLTGALHPLLGYGLALAGYWAFLAVMLLRFTTRAQRSDLLVARSPGRGIGVLLVLPVVGIGTLGMAALNSGLLPSWLVLAIALAAIANGILEELFWRGAMLPDPEPDTRSILVSLGLFTVLHLALVPAQGISVTGGPAVMVLGAGALGAIWMAARLATGTVGASILSHAAVNLFAFLDLAARNL